MTDLAVHEYTALRETIRSRGTVRPVLCLAGVAAWAVVLSGILIWLPNPIAAAVPLLLLLTSFEIGRALHLGVERIGRYLQVFFEEQADTLLTPPAWERTAMLVGTSLPGAAVHPLFLPLYLFATLLNFLAVVLPGPLPVELAALAIPHAAFVMWLIYCDRGMRKQRAAELARYRALKDSAPDAAS